MDILKRELAPISTAAWQQVDDEARRVLRLHLAGRKIVDFSGPHGWGLGAVNTGRLKHMEPGPLAGVSHAIRDVLPLVEVRAPIVLSTLELDYAERGATDLDLDPVIATAERVARAEDDAIFHGFAPGNISGIVGASPHSPIDVSSSVEWPRAVSRAKEALRLAGVGGPYALALGPKAHAELSADSDDGYPLRRRVESILGDEGELVWAPVLGEGAVLLSTRGGDYELSVGQDWSIGYAGHSRTEVELYLTESFTFRILENKAAISLRRPA